MFANWKNILVLAIPSVASFATMTITGTFLLIMLGPLGFIVIAVVGVSNIIMYNAWALFSGIGHTVNYLVAQNYGENQMKKAIERMNVALMFSLLFAVLLFIFGVLFSKYILAWIGTDGELAAVGNDYLQVRFFASSFGIIIFAFHGFFRGIGDTKTPMWLSIISSALTVLFTYGLTYGKLGLPEIGLIGAGYAMLIGEGVALLGCLFVYFVRLHPQFGTRTFVRPSLSESKLVVAESGKIGFQEFAMSVSMLIFTFFVGKLGSEALAANEIALNVMSIGFMPAFAFGATATILVGQQIGRGNPLAARRVGTDTAILGSIFLLVLGGLEFIFAKQVASFYTKDAELIMLVAMLIKISAFMQVFDGLFNFYAGCLRGIGVTTFLFVSSLVFGFVVFVPLSYVMIFTFDLGSVGAWLSLYIYLTLFAVTLLVRFYKTDWSSVRVKQAG